MGSLPETKANKQTKKTHSIIQTRILFNEELSFLKGKTADIFHSKLS